MVKRCKPNVPTSIWTETWYFLFIIYRSFSYLIYLWVFVLVFVQNVYIRCLSLFLFFLVLFACPTISLMEWLDRRFNRDAFKKRKLKFNANVNRIERKETANRNRIEYLLMFVEWKCEKCIFIRNPLRDTQIESIRSMPVGFFCCSIGANSFFFSSDAINSMAICWYYFWDGPVQLHQLKELKQHVKSFDQTSSDKIDSLFSC